MKEKRQESRLGQDSRGNKQKGQGHRVTKQSEDDLRVKMADTQLKDQPPPNQDDEFAVDPEMAAVMGFAGFGSTKGQHVVGNKDGQVKVANKARKYRQYLFVKGAYNIPLTRQQLEEKQARDAARGKQPPPS